MSRYWRGFSLMPGTPVVQLESMPDQPIDFLGAEVDSRSDELSKEFIEHRDDFIKEHPTATDSNIIFQSWAIHKIAGLQLQVEQHVLLLIQLESRK